MRAILFLLFLACLSPCRADPVPYKQLFAGFNGPRVTDTHFFTSVVAVRSSWLATAMPAQLEKVLSEVDFAHQMLVVSVVGEHGGATGQVKIVRIEVSREKRQTYGMAFVAIGVNGAGCKQKYRRSYPFVVAVIEKEPNIQSGGYDDQNFPDGCKPTISGTSHD